MELRSPKLRVLPLSNDVSAILDEDKLWEIDSPSLERSLGLAYLFSIVDKMDFENIISKLIGLEEVPKTDHWISKIKSSITKYNPFKNRRAIYSDRIIKMILNKIKIQLHGEINIDEQELLKVHLQLESASKLFDCAVLLYRGEPSTNCEFISMHKNDNLSIGDSLKIVIFQSAVLPPTDESSPSSRFGFGLSMAYCQPLRHSSIVNCLKTAKIPDDKILQVEQATFSDTSLLKCIFDAGCEDIIPSIYRSSYLVLRISEAGFDIDPCTLDNNGLSSFYYSMGLPKSDSLNMIYNFATNNFHLTDSSVRKPDKNILLALEKVESVIKKDCVVSDNFSLLNVRKCAASKRCQEILFFNKYQREICQLVYDLKKEKNSMERNKQVMVSILDTYRKYLYFDSIFSDDNLQLFKNFVKYSEYHENLDNFNCLLFFDNFSAMIPLISNNHLKNISDAISSLFLSVLSNEFIPKHKHEIDCTNCKLSSDVCDQNENIQRFIPFNYRICFSEKAHYLANISSSEQQQDPFPLLYILRKSLVKFPEIVDEFIVTRLTSYLEVASIQLHESPIKRMLTMVRALQVVGEVFGNKTVCKSAVKILLQSCVPAEVVNKLICLRDNTFSHYRRNSVHGRLKMEKNKKIADNIQEELSNIDDNFLPVYISQIYRVKEFLIKEGKNMPQNKFGHIQEKMDIQLREFIDKRKPLYGTHEVNFEYILFNAFKKLYSSLNVENIKDMQIDLKATYFLLNFITGHSSSKYSNDLRMSSTAVELRQIITSFEADNNISDVAVNKIKKIIRFHLNILEKIFVDEQEETITNTDFPFIYSLNDKIKNAKLFNAKAKRNIKREVIKYVNNSTILMQTLKKCLSESTRIDDLNNTLEYMILPEEKRVDLNKYIGGENIEIGFKSALKILSPVKGKEYLKKLFTFDENGDIPQTFRGKEELMNMLLKIKLPKTLRKRVVRILNTKLFFLINRIDQLKAILISEDDNLHGLWRSRKWKFHSTIDKHMKYIMIQRYMREKDLQASLEMLLFDCMNILEKRKDLKALWEKTNDLFKGANVINVLAHGNTIIQNVGSILSPEDLPSEFIEKILELIKDVDSMRALSELWSKTKLCKKTHFLLAAKSEVADEHSELRKRIKTSSRWEEYACLLPLKDY